MRNIFVCKRGARPMGVLYIILEHTHGLHVAVAAVLDAPRNHRPLGARILWDAVRVALEVLCVRRRLVAHAAHEVRLSHEAEVLCSHTGIERTLNMRFETEAPALDRSN